MIHITLYRNTKERNSLVADLSSPIEGGALEGYLRDATSLLNIEITLDKSPTDIYRANYLYVQELRRYYHINNITAFRTGLTKLNCSLDPLFTYRNSILDCPGLIGRCESVSSHKYIQDNKFAYSVIPAMIRQPFSKSPTDTTLVLLVTAGADQVP